jgi:uncharacterized membrane protein YgdD (TMEM256/DUF423 family)
MSLPIVRLAGVLGAMGVGAGAYGSHMLEAGWQQRGFEMDSNDIQRWQKAWHSGWVMNMTGAAATLGIASLQQQLKRPTPVAALVGGGTLVFSVSTYLAAYHADRKYAVGGPIGGSSVILGWLLLALVP